MHRGDRSLHVPPPAAIVSSSLLVQVVPFHPSFQLWAPCPLHTHTSGLPHTRWRQLPHLVSHSLCGPWYICGLLVDVPGGWFRLPFNRMSTPLVGFIYHSLWCLVETTGYC